MVLGSWGLGLCVWGFLGWGIGSRVLGLFGFTLFIALLVAFLGDASGHSRSLGCPRIQIRKLTVVFRTLDSYLT